MEDFFQEYVANFDISNIHYDVEPFTYFNPKKKVRPKYRALSEVGFPYDIVDASSYYNYQLSQEFHNKMRAHWKRKLPEFKNNFIEYMLVFNDREKAIEKFVSDCEPYGVSEEEAINHLQDRYLYFLEPENTLEVVKEFIFIILEYAPNNFNYFTTCYGLDKSYKYKEPYRVAEEILSAKIDIINLTPRVIQREIVKGTPLIDIYKNVFENKSAIKDSVKSFSRDSLSATPYDYYHRKIERILLSQSNLDYKIDETINGIKVDYALYDDGVFLFGLIFDDDLVLYDYEGDDYVREDDEFCPEQAIRGFDEQIKTIKAFDIDSLSKGVALYHVDTASLDELDNEISSDIRSIRKDISFLLNIIKNGTQYSRLREFLLEDFEDYE